MLSRPKDADGLRKLLERRVVCLLGLPVDVIDMVGAVRAVRGAARYRTRCFLSTPNLNFAIGSLKDEGFRNTVIDSDLSVADGMPFVWLARLLQTPVLERVAGAALLEQLRRAPPEDRLCVYFFGGEDGAAQAAAEQLAAESSALTCVGYESPGFGSVEQLSRAESIERINVSGADFLVVSLGAKKGQGWIERNLARIDVPVVSHLGAALNFIAGKVRRAPRWAQRTGLEWVWRIKEEPALWRRYLRDGVTFLQVVTTRILPLAWALRARRPSQSDVAAATVTVEDSRDEIVVRLQGPWTGTNLRRVRDAFLQAADAHRDIRIDLGRVPYVDLEFLGLLVLLHGHQRRRGRRWRCGPVDRRLVRIIRGSCADYLLVESPAR